MPTEMTNRSVDLETLDKIKAAMGYHDGTRCCKVCKHFVPTDCSGSHNAKDSHCKLSPAFEVPVTGSGYCDFFALKPASSTKL